MPDDKAINTVRGLGYMAGILMMHQEEPLCGRCRAYAKTADAVSEALRSFKESSASAGLPAEMQRLYAEAGRIISAIRVPEEPVPQRKLGACRLPEKACFLKYSRKFFDNIIESSET